MSDAIEKIKKLLRLARSSNPHEAKLALARAMALATEHDVEIEGLNPDECAQEKRLTHEETEPAARMSYDARYAWSICRSHFNVTTVEMNCIRLVDGWPRRAVKLAVVGTPAAIVIARYVHAFLVQHFAFCWRRHRGRLRNRQAFVHGMFIGIVVQLNCERPSAKGTELVVRDRQDYIARHIGKTTCMPMGRPDHEAHAAARAGYSQGLNTRIRQPLAKGASEPLALSA